MKTTKWEVVGMMLDENYDPLSRSVIGAAIEVHRAVGPGLLESAYEECLCCELTHRSVAFARQLPLAIVYKTITVEQAYRMDLVVEQQLIVEIKAVEAILPIHEALAHVPETQRPPPRPAPEL